MEGVQYRGTKVTQVNTAAGCEQCMHPSRTKLTCVCCSSCCCMARTHLLRLNRSSARFSRGTDVRFGRESSAQKKSARSCHGLSQKLSLDQQRATDHANKPAGSGCHRKTDKNKGDTLYFAYRPANRHVHLPRDVLNLIRSFPYSQPSPSLPPDPSIFHSEAQTQSSGNLMTAGPRAADPSCDREVRGVVS